MALSTYYLLFQFYVNHGNLLYMAYQSLNIVAYVLSPTIIAQLVGREVGFIYSYTKR